MIERFLARLGKSKYVDHLILKGGTLLSKYTDIGRETRDLDFLAHKISNEINTIENIFKEIADIQLLDGFEFREVQAEKLMHNHMQYSGVEISMIGYFSKTRFKVQIDLGFGDMVEPIKYAFPLLKSSKGPFFESELELACYPKEYIFAEKLETLASRGYLNSRMKDFHDLYWMATQIEKSDFKNLKSIVLSVFNHRSTRIQFPIKYSRDGIDNLQQHWKGYLTQLQLIHQERLPKDISEIIEKINHFLSVHKIEIE